MESQVRTLYDFEGDSTTGELSFAVGEILIITNKDVDEGWWEGRKSDGTIGLFPQAYVQGNPQSLEERTSSTQEEAITSLPQDSFQQSETGLSLQDQIEPTPAAFTEDPFQTESSGSAYTHDPFQTESFGSVFGQDPFEQVSDTGLQDTNGDIFGGFPSPVAAPQNVMQSAETKQQDVANNAVHTNDDIFGGFPSSSAASQNLDSELDHIEMNTADWTNSASAYPATTPTSPTSTPQASSSTTAQRKESISSNAASPIKRSNTLKISLFSNFTKSAGALYVLGDSKVNVSSVKKFAIELGADGPMWQNAPQVFSCKIANPMKETKYKIKNYIAYEVTPSNSKRSVSRRYKHFDWLYEQLQRKFGFAISVPPLPGKQITGRYEDDFVEGRRAQLEAWLGRMGIHPVVSQAEVLNHFLSYHRNEKDWKAGKRRAEKDEVVGVAFIETVLSPNQMLELRQAELTLESYSKFARSTDDACKQLISVGIEHTKSFLASQKDNESLSQAFQLLGDAFSLDVREVAQSLTLAIKNTGSCYQAIGEFYGDQSKHDWNPFLTGLNEYKAVLSTFPAILANQKNSLDKNKEIQRMYSEGKMSQEEMKNAAARTEKLCYIVQSEMNHFQLYRVGDFVGYMTYFLQQQIAFHQKIIAKLEKSLFDYQNIMG